MTKSKTTKGNAAAKRARMVQEKRLKYFMENRHGEFRMKVISSKRDEPKIRPHNVERYIEDEDC